MVLDQLIVGPSAMAYFVFYVALNRFASKQRQRSGGTPQMKQHLSVEVKETLNVPGQVPAHLD